MTEANDHPAGLPLITRCHTCGDMGIPISFVTGRCANCCTSDPISAYEPEPTHELEEL